MVPKVLPLSAYLAYLLLGFAGVSQALICDLTFPDKENWLKVVISISSQSEASTVITPSITRTDNLNFMKCTHDKGLQIVVLKGEDFVEQHTITDAWEYEAGAAFTELLTCTAYTALVKPANTNYKKRRDAYPTLKKTFQLPPKTNAPKVFFNPDHDSVDVSFELGDKDCHLKDFIATLFCSQKHIIKRKEEMKENANTGNWEFKVDNLVPGKHYHCEYAYVEYETDRSFDRSNLTKALQFQTLKAELMLTPKRNPDSGMIDVTLNPSNMKVTASGNYSIKGDWNNIQLNDFTRGLYQLTGLKHNTDYTVCVTFWPLNTQNCQDCQSDICQDERTLQGKPDTPEKPDVIQAERTETSITIVLPQMPYMNGIFTKFEIIVSGNLQEIIELCEAEQDHKKTFSIGNRVSIRKTTLSGLKPFHKYAIKIRVLNSEYSSDWSDIVHGSTQEGIQAGAFIESDFKVSIHNSSWVTFTVQPKCMYARKIFITAFKKMYENDPDATNVIYNHGYEDTTFVVKNKYDPGKNYNLCLKFCLLNQVCNEKTCQLVTMPEEPPFDGPILNVSSSSLLPSGFKLDIQDPLKPNGKITIFSYTIQKRCPFQDSQCPECTRFIDDGSDTIDKKGFTTTKKFEAMKPFTMYNISVEASNSAGTGPSSNITKTTLASLSNYKPTFTHSSGGTYISLNVKPGCPYQGPVHFKFTSKQVDPKPSWNCYSCNKEEQITYDIGRNETSLSAKIDDLNPGFIYKVCLDTELTSCNRRKSTCKLPFPNCTNIRTECHQITKPSKKLNVVSWDGSFDPFLELKVMLLANTFNGSQSGITDYELHCPKKQHQEHFGKKESVKWDTDSPMIISDMSPGTEYQLAVTAFGCNNSTEITEYVVAETKSISKPVVTLETHNYAKKIDEDTQVLNNPDNEKVMIGITDSNLNIDHTVFSTYTIDHHTLRYVFENRGPCIMFIKMSDTHQKCLLILELGSEKEQYDISSYSNKYNVNYEFILAAAPTPTPWALYTSGGTFIIIIPLILGLLFWKRELITGSVTKFRNTSSRASDPASLQLTPPKKAASGRPLTPRQLQNLVSQPNFNDIIQAEYRALSQEDRRNIGLTKTTDTASDPAKRDLNRYSNILPYDDTRVKLREGSQNYVNASWVRGFLGRRFIAAQGPKENTCAHFWQMVFENDVAKIIMVTKLKEKKPGSPSIEKCYKYWPSQGKSVSHGDFKIKCTEDTTHAAMSDLHMRKMTITHHGTSKTCLQLHYRGWPDHGVPTTTAALLTLNKLKSDLTQGDLPTTPIVVHCSAGVGRTGTLIGLDTLTREMDAEEQPEGGAPVDVYKCVYRMREDRTLLVQQSVQYDYLYRCVAAYLEEKERQNQPSGPVYMDEDEDINGEPNYIYYNELDQG